MRTLLTTVLLISTADKDFNKMATRFYFEPTTAADVSPSFDGGWEQTGQAVRRMLTSNLNITQTALTNSATITIPVTTTQDILCYQFVSSPLRPQVVGGAISMVIRTVTDNITTGATLAMLAKVVSNDGGTSRGTLFSVFGTGSTYNNSAETRIVSSSALTNVIAQAGDRLVIEVGTRATTPAIAGTYNMRAGSSASTDFALTAGLTTDLNPWVEFSQNINFSYPKQNAGLRPNIYAPGIAR